MQRARGMWASLTGGEKTVVTAVGLALLATIALAGVALVKRPADISNPDAFFQAEAPQPRERDEGKGKRRKRDRRVDWPRFGYDLERTKFLDAQHIRPPFRRVWSYRQDQLIEFAPIVHGKRLYFVDNDGVFVALNSDNGKVHWRKQHGRLNASSPAYQDGVLYAVNLQPPQALAIRARDGKRLWTRPLPSRAESSPLVLRKRMYFGTEGGDFFALDPRNGNVVWQRKLAGAIKAAPAFSDGSLYVGDYAGRFYSLRAGDGAIRWQASDLGSGLGRGGRFYSTPAVAFGRVYVGNVDGRVYSFEQRSGKIAWTQSAGHYVYSGVAAARTRTSRPAVYFGSHDRHVYSLDARTGKVIWREQPGGQVSGPATVIGRVVYVSTFSGNATVGFDIRSGRRIFKLDDGEYGPAVSDGVRLYVTGGASVIAFDPVHVEGSYRTRRKGVRGIISAAELRRVRQREARRERRAKTQRERQRGRDRPPAGRRGD